MELLDASVIQIINTLTFHLNTQTMGGIYGLPHADETRWLSWSLLALKCMYTHKWAWKCIAVKRSGGNKKNAEHKEIWEIQIVNMPKELIIFPLCGQVGYIQIGTEQLLIQPVNISETSFSGREHFIRHKRSPKSSYPAKSQVPDQPCKVISGEFEKRHKRSTAWMHYGHDCCSVKDLCSPVLQLWILGQ